MTRSESRRNAFLLLFSLYVNDDTELSDTYELEDGLVIEPDDFCRSLVNTTCDNLAQIDEEISHYLDGWTLDRVPKASLALLRLSAAQLLFMQDIPTAVVINEAVELSKQFGNSDDYVFINGALGSLARGISGNK